MHYFNHIAHVVFSQYIQKIWFQSWLMIVHARLYTGQRSKSINRSVRLLAMSHLSLFIYSTILLANKWTIVHYIFGVFVLRMLVFQVGQSTIFFIKLLSTLNPSSPFNYEARARIKCELVCSLIPARKIHHLDRSRFGVPIKSFTSNGSNVRNIFKCSPFF